MRDSLGLREVHLYGSSWGTMLATDYFLTHPAGIKSLTAISDGALAERARWVEAFDREQGFLESGDTSTTNWLRNNCHLSGGSADGQVRLARQLPELQETQKALVAGEIGIEHAVEIARATNDLGAAAEGELLSAARSKDPVELRETAREIRHRVDAEGMARLAQEQYRKRRLRVFNLADGMVGVDIRKLNDFQRVPL